MPVFSQTQELRFRLIPRTGNTVVRSYTWANFCTINLRLPELARLVKLSAFFKPLFSENDITTPKQYEQVPAFNWGVKGVWFGQNGSLLKINSCSFNCPIAFAALAVATQENYFLSNDYPVYQRECLMMGGYSIEYVFVEFVDSVDIAGVPNPPFGDRFLNLDLTLTIEYDL